MPSSKVKADAEELENFARELLRINSDFADRTRRLSYLVKRLGETWEDPAYDKFADEYLRTIKHLKDFLTISETIPPKLKKTAGNIRHVHNP